MPGIFKLWRISIKWVKVMYRNPRCKIVNNGYISESFKLSRGVKQGCPLSAYLQCLAKVFGPLELCDLLTHFRLQT